MKKDKKLSKEKQIELAQQMVLESIDEMNNGGKTYTLEESKELIYNQIENPK